MMHVQGALILLGKVCRPHVLLPPDYFGILLIAAWQCLMDTVLCRVLPRYVAGDGV